MIQKWKIQLFTLLDIYCISPRIILQIPFTVSNCNTICIMGILWCYTESYRIFLIALYYCIAITASLTPFNLRCLIFLISYIWTDRIRPVYKLQAWDSPHWICISLVMIGKYICPSCQKQHKLTVRIHSLYIVSWIIMGSILSSVP